MRPAIVAGVVRRTWRQAHSRAAVPRPWRSCSRRRCSRGRRARKRTDTPPAPTTTRRRHRSTDAPPAVPDRDRRRPRRRRPLREDAAPEPNVPSFEPGFGPRYHIEQIVVSGNHKTKTELILREIGLAPGDVISASDQRVEAARFRLLSRGFFLDVRLSLMRGKKRGSAILLVEVEERGTIVINDLYPSTSAATTFWGGIDVSETNFLGRGVNLGGAFVVSTTPKVPDARAGVGAAPARVAAGAPQPGREPVAHRALQRRQRVLPGRRRRHRPRPRQLHRGPHAPRRRHPGRRQAAGPLPAPVRRPARGGGQRPAAGDARPASSRRAWSSQSTSTSTRATAGSAR